MGSWKTQASAASVAGACVFAVVTGAGAVFVGDWWGQHHAPVVTQFVTTPASPAPSGHSSAATARPAASFQPSGMNSPARHGGGDAQADAQAARVARTARAARAAHTARPGDHPATPTAPAPVTTGGTTGATTGGPWPASSVTPGGVRASSDPAAPTSSPEPTASGSSAAQGAAEAAGRSGPTASQPAS